MTFTQWVSYPGSVNTHHLPGSVGFLAHLVCGYCRGSSQTQNTAIAADTLTNIGCGEFVFKYAIQRSASTEKECMVVKSKYRQGGAPGDKRVTQLLELEYFEFVQGRQ